MAIQIRTYGDLKKLVSAIKNKQTAANIVSKGKEVAINQLLGLIPGASNVADIGGLVQSAFKKPDTEKTNTWLDNLDIDDQMSAIVDDAVENGYLKSLIRNIQSKDDREALPDDFSTTKDLQLYLKNKYRGRSVTNTNNENIYILQELLLQEVDEKPKTFEEDPMEFILNKYVSLDDILTELMTSSYREYLNAVYIISPKPTSFKVVLHNEQHFYLTYMGPAYEASVAGKNYYLLNVGEKERCMLAISKLLRGGNPLKTKGPEGAEQGAEAEEGGESEGSELSATGGAETGGGAEGGEEESLTESKKYENKLVLKLILERELDKIEKDVEGDEETVKDTETKKKSRFPETPILTSNSVNPQALGLEKSSYGDPKKIISVVKNSINNKIVGNDKKQVENTKNFMLSLCEDVINSSVDSGLTDGIENINFSKNTIEALSGVNRIDLNTIGIEFGEVLGAIYSTKKNYASGKTIIFPTEQNNPIFDFRIQEIDNKENNINVSSKYKKGASSSLRQVVDENSKNKDTLKISGETEALLNILEKSYEKSASISYLYIAKSLNDKNIEIAFTALREELGIDIKISDEDETIKSYINNTLKTIRENKGNRILTEMLNNFYGKIGRKKIKEGSEVMWDKLPVKGDENNVMYYGLVTSPIAYFLTSVINKGEGNENYKELLSNMIRNTEIKQLRLNFSLREKSAKFNSQSSKNDKANFVFFPGKISSNEPEKGFMSFRME